MTTTTTSNATNHSLVGNALQLLGVGLGPYVIGRLREAAGRGRYVPDDSDTMGDIEGDVAVMLKVMASGWNDIFRDELGPIERSLVSEIREIRNRWAHMEAFDDDDLDRALDSVGRLLEGVGARHESERVHKAKNRLRTKRYAASKSTDAGAGASRQPARDTAGATPPNLRSADRAPVTPDPEATTGETADSPASAAVDYTDPGDAIIERGISNRKKGDFGRAMADFDEAIGINRDNAHAWYHRALTWGHMGEFKRAINDFNRVISLDNGYADAYNGRGFAWYCLGDLARAISDYEAALKFNPDDELTRINLAKAQARNR